MNREDIIRMAREAGMAVTAPSWGYSDHYHFAGYEDKIQRFAALVEERTNTNNKARWYQEGVEAEREACAKLAEEPYEFTSEEAHRIAAAIRARANGVL